MVLTPVILEVSGEQVHRWYSDYLTGPEPGVHTTFQRWLRHHKTHGRKFEMQFDTKRKERSWMRVHCHDDVDAIRLKLKW